MGLRKEKGPVVREAWRVREVSLLQGSREREKVRLRAIVMGNGDDAGDCNEVEAKGVPSVYSELV